MLNFKHQQLVPSLHSPPPIFPADLAWTSWTPLPGSQWSTSVWAAFPGMHELVTELTPRGTSENLTTLVAERCTEWGIYMCVFMICIRMYICTVLSRKSAHGRCILLSHQTGGWALFRVFPHSTLKERPPLFTYTSSAIAAIEQARVSQSPPSTSTSLESLATSPLTTSSSRYVHTYVRTYQNLSRSGMLIILRNFVGFPPAKIVVFARGLDGARFTILKLRSVDQHGASRACRARADIWSRTVSTVDICLYHNLVSHSQRLVFRACRARAAT